MFSHTPLAGRLSQVPRATPDEELVVPPPELVLVLVLAAPLPPAFPPDGSPEALPPPGAPAGSAGELEQPRTHTAGRRIRFQRMRGGWPDAVKTVGSRAVEGLHRKVTRPLSASALALASA
jgi:hypothetical protein